MAAIDLYDFEMKKIADVYGELTVMLERGVPNTDRGIKEFTSRAADLFHKAGFIVTIDASACKLMNPKTGRSYSPEIEVVGRVEDPFSMTEIDHDKKRFEVIDANAYGEKYRGEKRSVNKGARKGY